MRPLPFLALFALLTLHGCSLLPGTGGSLWPEINKDDLTQHWVRSYEEEPQGSALEVYRPSDYKDFPASRFRMQYIFEEGGDCEWFYLDPNDAHHFRSGTWRLERGNILAVEQGEETVRYLVVELTEELLHVKRLATESN